MQLITYTASVFETIDKNASRNRRFRKIITMSHLFFNERLDLSSLFFVFEIIHRVNAVEAKAASFNHDPYAQIL